MASLSSLFGVGTQQQQQPQAAAVTTQELPKQIAPYYEKLLKEAEALYKQKMEAGAPIYEGKTIAGYTPEQEQLFSGLQSLQGTQAPKFAEAEALTRGTAARVTPDEVQEYMNPYQQAVVDIEKREAEKQYQSTVVPQLAAQAAAAGSFGGSRQGILEGMASEANQRLQADIQAKGSAQAYQDAMSNINQQRQREGAAAGQLAQLAPAGFAAQAQELGAIGKVGDVKQQQSQLALDEAYKQYIQEQQFPSESLKEYQSYVQSFPNIATQITRTPPPAQPSLAQTLIGGLGTAAGTYGAFGGFSPGGFMGMKQAETGGGISGLPVVRAAEGTGDKSRFRSFLDTLKQRSDEEFESRKDRTGLMGYGLGDLLPDTSAIQGISDYIFKPKSEVEGKSTFQLGREAAMKRYKKNDPNFDKIKETRDPNQIAMIGPGLGDEGETYGTVMKIDPETGKEDMSQLRVDKSGQPSKEKLIEQGFEPLPNKEAPTVQKEFSDIVGEAKVKEPVKTEPSALDASQEAYTAYLAKMSDAAKAEKGILDQESATMPYLRLLQASAPVFEGKSSITEGLTNVATSITKDKQALNERKKVIDGKVDTINLQKLKFTVDKEVGKANQEWIKEKAKDESKDRKTKLAIDYLSMIAKAQSKGKKTFKIPKKGQTEVLTDIVADKLSNIKPSDFNNMIENSNMSRASKDEAIKNRDKFIKAIKGNKNVMNTVTMKILEKDGWDPKQEPTNFILNNFADTLRDTSSGIPLVYDKGSLFFGTPTLK